MDFITKDHNSFPINNGSGVSSSVIGSPVHSHHSMPSIKQESHNNRLQNFLKSRHLAHHAGKAVGTAIAKKKLHDEQRKEMKKQMDNQIDSIIDDKEIPPKAKFRMLQRFHYANRKRLTADQKHIIRQEIMTLAKKRAVTNPPKPKTVETDHNPTPVTFASQFDEPAVEQMVEPTVEQVHEKPLGLSERIVEEELRLQVKK